MDGGQGGRRVGDRGEGSEGGKERRREMDEAIDTTSEGSAMQRLEGVGVSESRPSSLEAAAGVAAVAVEQWRERERETEREVVCLCLSVSLLESLRHGTFVTTFSLWPCCRQYVLPHKACTVESQSNLAISSLGFGNCKCCAVCIMIHANTHTFSETKGVQG